MYRLLITVAYSVGVNSAAVHSVVVEFDSAELARKKAAELKEASLISAYFTYRVQELF